MNQLDQSIQALLVEQRITYGAIRSFGTPRRLAVLIENVATKQPSAYEEVLGPSKAAAFDVQGQPTKAAQGFAKSQGIDAKSLEVRETPKGEYVCAVKCQDGRRTDVVLKETLSFLIKNLSFPKTMKWNATGVRYPRPIRWILALLGPNIISIEVAGVQSWNRTFGHRFLSGNKGSSSKAKGIEIKNPEAYESTLEQAGVVADPEQRRIIMQSRMNILVRAVEGKVYQASYGELIEQAVFSVECPNVVCGTFDKQYLKLPSEVLITAMKEHQGFFSVINTKQALLPNFLAPSNMKIPTMDLITVGNERVLAARLADAKYFFEDDCKSKLADRVNKLNGVVFHKKLGTLYQKTERMVFLIGVLAEAAGLGSFKEACQRSAFLSKADLSTGMVGEFPTLQGVMGREYAIHDRETPVVCQALGEYYQPGTPEDNIPKAQVGQLLSLADRLDTLAAFFHVGMVPSGSEDPFALRRQAFGLVRILVEATLHVNLIDLLRQAEQLLEKQGVPSVVSSETERVRAGTEPLPTLVEFLADRLRFFARTLHGVREDVIDAVLKGRVIGEFSLTDLFSRMLALQAITHEEDFDPLMVGFKRAHRLVEKEQWTSNTVNIDLLTHRSEKDLLARLVEVRGAVGAAIGDKDYSLALKTLIGLKSAIDVFFDGVLVNAPEAEIRANRLSLLRKVDELFLGIGDLSKIQVQGQQNT